MNLMFVLTMIACLKSQTTLTQAAPNRDNAASQVNRKSKDLWGFPITMTKEILRKRLSRESDAIVFNGPTNGAPSSSVLVLTDAIVASGGVIHFPKEHSDYDEIDLSGSFTIKTTTKAPNTFAPLQIHIQKTFANCGSITKDGVLVATSSSSGVYTYPNGTQVAYSKCQVLQTINNPS